MRLKNGSLFALALLFFVAGVIIGCSKSSSSSDSDDDDDSYATCPSTGYYTNSSGVSYSCTPGTTVYVGTSGAYTTCPSTGYYYSNNVKYYCQAGTTVQVVTANSGYSVCSQTGSYLVNGTSNSCAPGVLLARPRRALPQETALESSPSNPCGHFDRTSTSSRQFGVDGDLCDVEAPRSRPQPRRH